MKLNRGSEEGTGSMIMRGTARLVGGRVARMSITFAGVAILARLLAPEDFGVVAVATMILPLANALLEGLIDVPTIREDSLDHAGLANLIWVGVALMTALSGILWLLAPWLALLLNSPSLTKVLRVMCLAILLQPFIAASYALLRREHRFGAAALFMPIAGATYVISAISLALLGFGVWSLVLGQIISLIITGAGLALISGIPLLPPKRVRTAAAWRLGGLGLATRLMSWMTANIDTLFASALLGAVGAGLYSRAYNISTQMKEPFALLDQTVRQAFVAQRNLDDADAARATLGGLRLVVLAVSLVSAFVIVVREPLVAVLLGPQWEAVALPMAILAASLPARVARLYVDGFTYARGSLRHMLVRDILMVALLGIGLWLWAADGVVAIALVVASVHIAKLFFTGGAVDVAIAGTIRQRAKAMFPGILLAFVAVGATEGVSALMNVGSQYHDYATRVAVFTILVAIGVQFCSPNWIPSSLGPQLPKFVGLFWKERHKLP